MVRVKHEDTKSDQVVKPKRDILEDCDVFDEYSGCTAWGRAVGDAHQLGNEIRDGWITGCRWIGSSASNESSLLLRFTPAQVQLDQRLSGGLRNSFAARLGKLTRTGYCCCRILCSSRSPWQKLFMPSQEMLCDQSRRQAIEKSATGTWYTGNLRLTGGYKLDAQASEFSPLDSLACASSLYLTRNQSIEDWRRTSSNERWWQTDPAGWIEFGNRTNLADRRDRTAVGTLPLDYGYRQRHAR